MAKIFGRTADDQAAAQADHIRRVPLPDVMRIFVRKPGFLLSRLDQIANALYGALTTGGETLAQAEILLAIEAMDASDQVGLARACGIDTSTTAVILDNLVATGLVAREQDPHDRRRSLPVLTEEGEARMPGVRQDFAALQIALMEGFSEADRAVFVALLGELAASGDHSAPRWDAETSPFVGKPSFVARRALQIAHAQFAASIAPLTLTLRQFSALVILHLHPGLSQVEFARAYGLDPSTCAIVLKKLAARGLLAAVRSPDDRRKTLYATTPEGSDQAAALQPIADESEKAVMVYLGRGRRDELLKMLQVIVRCHAGKLRFPGCLPWDG